MNGIGARSGRRAAGAEVSSPRNAAILNDFLLHNGFALMLVFARMGAVFMVLPGFSANYVTTQVRLLIALATTLLIEPAIGPHLPPLPTTVADLALLIGTEVTVGVFIGTLGQFALAALHLAGTSISRDSGLMNSSVIDPVTEQQGALVIGLLSEIAVLVIFVTNSHHLMIRAVIGSYGVFTPGHPLIVGDFASSLVDMLSRIFLIGLQLASPFLVFNLVYQTGLGLINRLAPQAAVSQIGMPLQILLGLALLWISVPAIIMWFMHYFQDVFSSMAAG